VAAEGYVYLYLPWAGGQGWEIEDTLVYLSGRWRTAFFVDISTMRAYLLILKRES